MTNKEIASEVFLSDKTVKNYVSTILSKLNLQRRAQAAAFVANTASIAAGPDRALPLISRLGEATAALDPIGRSRSSGGGEHRAEARAIPRTALIPKVRANKSRQLRANGTLTPAV